MLDGLFLVTGVPTELCHLRSPRPAKCRDSGAEVLLTSFGCVQGHSPARRVARPALDVTRTEDFAAAAAEIDRRWGRLDAALHAVAFAPVTLGPDFLAATWPDVSTALQVPAFSLKLLAESLAPPTPSGGSIVGLDFDAGLVWPGYRGAWRRRRWSPLPRWPARARRASGSTWSRPGRCPPPCSRFRQVELYQRMWKARAPAGLGTRATPQRGPGVRGPAVGPVDRHHRLDRSLVTVVRTPSEFC